MYFDLAMQNTIVYKCMLYDIYVEYAKCAMYSVSNVCNLSNQAMVSQESERREKKKNVYGSGFAVEIQHGECKHSGIFNNRQLECKHDTYRSQR